MKKLFAGMITAAVCTMGSAFAATTSISRQSLADTYSSLVRTPSYTTIGNKGLGTISWNRGENTANIWYDVVTDTRTWNHKIDVILKSRGSVNGTYTTMNGAATFVKADGQWYVMLKSWSMNPAIIDNTSSSWNDFIGRWIPLNDSIWHDPMHLSGLVLSGSNCASTSTGARVMVTGNSTVTGSVTTNRVWSGNVGLNTGNTCVSMPNVQLSGNIISGHWNVSGMLHNWNWNMWPGQGESEMYQWMGNVFQHLVLALQGQEVATGDNTLHLLGTLNKNRSVMTFDTNGSAEGSLIIAKRPNGIGVSAFDNMRNTLNLSYYVLPSMQTIFRVQAQDRSNRTLMRMNLHGKFYNAAGTTISAPTNVWSVNGR